MADVRVFVKATDQGSQVVQGAASKMTRALGDVSTRSGGLLGVLQRIPSAFGAIGGAVGGIARGLAVFGLAVQGVQALGGAVRGLGNLLGVGLNASLETTRAQLFAFTKDGAAADQILKDIQAEAAKTPFAFQEMAAATASLLPAAKQSGTALMDLVRQAEVLAALNPMEGLEGAAFALREALSGDFTSIIERFNLPRQRLNELKAEGVPAIEAVRIALQEMGVDASLVAGMGTTMNGRWSTFKDTLDQIKVRAGTALFDRLKGGLETLQGVLDRNIDKIFGWADAFSQALGDVIDEVAGFVGDVFQGFQALDQAPLSSNFAESLGQRLKDAFQFARDEVMPVVEEVFGAIVGRITEVFQTLAPVVQEVFGILRDAFSQLDPQALELLVSPLMVLAREALPLLAPLVQTVTDAFIQFANDAAPVVSDLLTRLATEVLPPLSELIGNVATVMGEWAEAVLPIVAEGLGLLITKLGELLVWINNNEAALMVVTGLFIALMVALFPIPAAIIAVGLAVGIAAQHFDEANDAIESFVKKAQSMQVVGDFIDVVVSHFQHMVSGVQNVIEGVIQIVEGFVDVIGGLLEGDFGRVWDGVKQIFEGALQALSGVAEIALASLLALIAGFGDDVLRFFSDLPGHILTALGALGGLLLDAGSALMRGLWDGIQALWGDVVLPWLEGVANAALAAVGGLASTLLESGKALLNGLFDGVLAIWEVVKTFFSLLPGRFAGYFAGAAGWLYDAGVSILTGLWEGMLSVFGTIKDGLQGLGESIVGWKGPPAKDAVMLYGNGVLIMEGLRRGLEAGFEPVKATLTAMAGEMGRAFSRPSAGGLNDALVELVAQFQDMASQFSEEGLEAAKQFADTAGAILSVIGDAVEGMLALPGITMPAQQAFEVFFGVLLNIGYMLERLPQLGSEMVDGISNFVDLVGAGLSVVTDLVDGLAVMDQVIPPSTLIVARFKEAIRIIGEMLDDLPGLGAHIAEKIQNFIDVVGAGVSIVGDLVEGLAVMDQIIPPSTLVVARFKEAIRIIGESLDDLPGLGANISAKIQQFIEVVGAGLGVVTGLVEGLAVMDQIIPPSKLVVARFVEAIRMLGSSLDDLPGLGEGIAAKIQAFIEVAGAGLALIGDAVDGLARLPELVMPDPAAFGRFAQALVSMVEALLQALEVAETDIRTRLMERVAGFAATAGAVLQALGEALNIFARWEEILAVVRKDEARFQAVMEDFVNRTVAVIVYAIEKLASRLSEEQATLAGVIGGAASAVMGGIAAAVDVMNSEVTGTVEQLKLSITTVMEGIIAAIEIIGGYAQTIEEIGVDRAMAVVAAVQAVLQPIASLMGSFSQNITQIEAGAADVQAKADRAKEKTEAALDSILGILGPFESGFKRFQQQVAELGQTFTQIVDELKGIVSPTEMVERLGALTEGLQSVSRFQAPSAVKLEEFAKSFGDFAFVVFDRLTRMSNNWAPAAVEAAHTLAGSLGQVVGFLKQAVEGFQAMDGFVAPDLGSFARFFGGLDTLLGFIVERLKDFPESVHKGVAMFADNVRPAVDLLKGAVEGLLAINAFTGLDGKAADRFFDALQDYLARFRARARAFGYGYNEEIKEFAGIVGAATGALKNAVEGLTGLVGFKGPSTKDIKRFFEVVLEVMEEFASASGELSDKMIEKILRFAAVLKAVGEALRAIVGGAGGGGSFGGGSNVLGPGGGRTVSLNDLGAQMSGSQGQQLLALAASAGGNTYNITIPVQTMDAASFKSMIPAITAEINRHLKGATGGSGLLVPESY